MAEAPAPTLTVEEALCRWPRLAEEFLRRRLACPGCAMARFDSLGDVARAYGLDLTRLLEGLGRAAGASRRP